MERPPPRVSELEDAEVIKIMKIDETDWLKWVECDMRWHNMIKNMSAWNKVPDEYVRNSEKKKQSLTQK